MSYSEALKYAEEVEAGIDRKLAEIEEANARYERECEEAYEEIREEAKAFFDSEECQLNEVHKQAFYKYLKKTLEYDDTLGYLSKGLDWIVSDFLEEYIEEICEMFKPISEK